VDALHRKKMSATWFPYTAIERLWGQLEEMQRASHSVDQCDRLKKLLHGALMSHLQQVKPHLNAENSVSACCRLLFLAFTIFQVVVDSEDVLSSMGGRQGGESQSS
jgi:nuclear pore complex protein Nup160